MGYVFFLLVLVLAAIWQMILSLWQWIVGAWLVGLAVVLIAVRTGRRKKPVP